MRWLLIAKHIEQHRGEAVHRIGGLPGRRGEVLGWQGKEGAVGQGVPVEKQYAVAGHSRIVGAVVIA